MIQAELKQNKPFATKAQEASIGLLRTAGWIKRSLAVVLEPHDITWQQYNILRILNGAGQALPTMEIGSRMIEETPGITRLIDRLEKKDLVKRGRGKTDRRQVYCSITTKGKKLAESLHDPVNQADGTALHALSESELETLISLLDKARSASECTDGQNDSEADS